MRTTEQITEDLWAVLDYPLVRVDDVWRAAMVRLANDVPGLLETSRSTAAAPQPRGTAPTAPGGAAGATNPTNQETQR